MMLTFDEMCGVGDRAIADGYSGGWIEGEQNPALARIAMEAAGVPALLAEVEQLRAEKQAAWRVGVEDGRNTAMADWDFALTEACELPDDVERHPMEVARYIARLRAALERIEDGRNHALPTRPRLGAHALRGIAHDALHPTRDDAPQPKPGGASSQVHGCT